MTKRTRTSGATPAPQPAKAPVPEKGGRIEVRINGVPVEVSPELEAAVKRACEGAIAPLPSEMTTTEAAEFLDVSRPFIIKLTKRGELPYRLVGKHRRIPSTALLEYREKMYRRAKEAADELTRISQELGLYDLDESPPQPR